MTKSPFGQGFQALQFYTLKRCTSKQKQYVVPPIMNENFKKIDKEFVVTDNSINVYGFKLLTSGYLKDEFLKIPYGYYDHKDEDGILVRWEDMRIDGEKVLAKPVINLNHSRGQRTVEEIENGFVKSASVGKLVILETTTEPHPTEKGKVVTVGTKWYNRELSLVGLPGNRNATIQLYDGNDKEIQLSDFLNTTIVMEKPKIPIVVLQALNLSDTDSENVSEALRVIQDLTDKAARTDKAEKALKDLQESVGKMAMKNLLDEAQTPGKAKITNELRAKLETQYAGRPLQDLKDLLDNMQVIGGVVEHLNIEADKNKPDYKDLADKSLEQLMELDLADKCLKEYPQLFEQKWIAEHGQESWDKSSYKKKVQA